MNTGFFSKKPSLENWILFQFSCISISLWGRYKEKKGFGSGGVLRGGLDWECDKGMSHHTFISRQFSRYNLNCSVLPSYTAVVCVCLVGWRNLRSLSVRKIWLLHSMISHVLFDYGYTVAVMWVGAMKHCQLETSDTWQYNLLLL